MKELLEYMVKELVDSPDDVEIEEVEEDEKTVIFNLKASATLYDATIFYEVDNIFGENYIDVYGFPVPKATIRIGVQWDFFN